MFRRQFTLVFVEVFVEKNGRFPGRVPFLRPKQPDCKRWRRGNHAGVRGFFNRLAHADFRFAASPPRLPPGECDDIADHGIDSFWSAKLRAF